LLTYTEIIYIYFTKKTDLIDDDCSDLMLCFQSFMGLGMLDIFIHWHIIGNIFYSTFTKAFCSCYVFNVFNSFLTFFTSMVYG